MRVLTKGGVWTNAEDEVLKAGIMKYGKNCWPRVASLLNKKTAKQCKARWYEWLDPSIKKTDWSREEEEKLLTLAKLMPNQWRTIAPIIGRTAGQCIEHYQKLLDQATGEMDVDRADDPRKLRAGEIDPQPEIKPARPDPIDMNEDEKEMLSEARARLSNTKGKKEKRKSRERQMEESRRLTLIQKRREMKAAGLDTDLKLGSRKRKFVDYSVSIPFQKEAPAGFYGTTSEKSQEKALKLDPKKSLLERGKMEFTSSLQEQEAIARKKGEKMIKKLMKDDAPAVIAAMSDELDPSAMRRRTQLSLPSAAHGDLGVSGGSSGNDNMKSMDMHASTNILISDHDNQNEIKSGSNRQALALKAPLRSEIMQQELQNHVALRNTPGPMGGEGYNDDGELIGDEDGVSERASISSIGVSVMTKDTTVFAATHSDYSTSSMSLNDQMRLNKKGNVLEAEFDVPLSLSSAEDRKKKTLQSLGNLPAPEYVYDITVPEDDEDKEGEEANEIFVPQEEDASVTKMKALEATRKEYLAKEMKKSSVVKRQLPRPSHLSKESKEILLKENTYLSGDKALAIASSLVNNEMVLLLEYDIAHHPYISNYNGKIKGKQVVQKSNAVQLESFDQISLENAKEIIDVEVQKMIEEDPVFLQEDSDHNKAKDRITISISESMKILRDNGVPKYIAAKKARQTPETKSDFLDVYSTKFRTLKQSVETYANKLSEVEAGSKRIEEGLKLKENLVGKNDLMNDTFTSFNVDAIDLASLQYLKSCEESGFERRLNDNSTDLAILEAAEKNLQTMYANVNLI